MNWYFIIGFIIYWLVSFRLWVWLCNEESLVGDGRNPKIITCILFGWWFCITPFAYFLYLIQFLTNLVESETVFNDASYKYRWYNKRIKPPSIHWS